MKVFVTGADGFIGSHLVERLIKLGHEVKAFTFYNFMGSNGWLDSIDKKLLKGLNIISGDIWDYGFLEKQIKGTDVIYHLAALKAIPYSYHSPQSYIDTNITGTYNVLKSSSILNCGYGTGYSVMQIIKIFKKISNTVIKIKYLERRLGDVSAVINDNKLFMKFLKK